MNLSCPFLINSWNLHEAVFKPLNLQFYVLGKAKAADVVFAFFAAVRGIVLGNYFVLFAYIACYFWTYVWAVDHLL